MAIKEDGRFAHFFLVRPFCSLHTVSRGFQARLKRASSKTQALKADWRRIAGGLEAGRKAQGPDRVAQGVSPGGAGNVQERALTWRAARETGFLEVAGLPREYLE
ncbi:hypothetical protein [Paraburkholderia dinghuensis]|uniref:hypothetical protein n=1 Tax=Paraburkholderia dinghuensis TaxID=2305225 RepID=UPI0011CEBAA7|nr:hypothetical protein [Paraburkholderia dinghuensis]